MLVDDQIAGAARGVAGVFPPALGGPSDLMVPGEIVNVAQIPVLGSGKTDYVTAQKIADEWVQSHRRGSGKVNQDGGA